MVHLVNIYKKIAEWRRNSISNDNLNLEFHLLGLRDLFQEITELRGNDFSGDDLKFHRNDLHINYVTIDSFSHEVNRESDGLGNVEPPIPTVGFLTEKLEVMFAVPTHLSFLRFSKTRNIEAFLCFIVELLYHGTVPLNIRVEILEKDLRCLLTILGDISWRFLDAGDRQPQFQSLLAGFEAAVNRAGRLVHSLLFSTHGSFERIDEEIAAVSNRTIHLLKSTLHLHLSTNIITTPNYTTPRTSIVDSFVVIESLLDDLQDLLKREDNPVADVKDEIKLPAAP